LVPEFFQEKSWYASDAPLPPFKHLYFLFSVLKFSLSFSFSFDDMNEAKNEAKKD
jgi:hypothetical protein